MRTSDILGIYLTLLVASASCSYGDPIEVLNHSFESPGGGNRQYPPATNWPGSSFTEISADIGITSGGDGARHNGQNSGSTANQNLGITFQANTLYTLSIAIGNRTSDPGNPTGTARFGLTADGGEVGTFTEAVSTADTFEDFTYTFTTGSEPPAGNLGIRLEGIGGRGLFDNVRLDAAPQSAILKITAITRPGNGTVVLSFDSELGKTYRVESSVSLTAGSWTVEGAAIVGTGANQTITVADTDATSRRFFRVKEQGEPLATPGSPLAVAYSSSLIGFSWTDVSGETGYEVQWDTTSMFTAPTTLPPLGSNATSAQVSGLTPATGFWFRVRALKTGGEPSAYSVANAATQALNTSPEVSMGGEVAVSSEPFAGEEGVKAFDGNTSTKWLGNMQTDGAWISYTFGGGASYRITGYSITSANDNPGRHPRDFRLQGSTDGGTTWMDIEGSAVNNQTYGVAFNEVEYGCPANGAFYPQVRLFIAANNGNTETGLGGTGLVQISELRLLGEPNSP